MARKARIPAHILNEARELMAKGHSLLNTRRLLSIRHKTEFSYYVLLYWLNDEYRQRKLERGQRRERVNAQTPITERTSDGTSQEDSGGQEGD